MITPEQIADHRAILVRIIQRGMRFTVGDAKLALAMLDDHALLSEVADAADSATRGGFELPRLRAALDALAANRVPPRPFAAADESVKRCEVCDWPMDREHGCHPGDCAYRPTQGTPEYARIRARRVHLAAQQPATAPAPSLEAQLAPVVDESEPPEGAMKTMWSLIHNCAAHPLLATGARWATRFHDWTADKAFGEPAIARGCLRDQRGACTTSVCDEAGKDSP